jgi:putative flippase GtrA
MLFLLWLPYQFYNISRGETQSMVQFVKYAIAGGFATFVHIVIFHLCAWKFFPSLQSNDFVVVIFNLTVTEVSLVTRSINSMISNAIAFFFSIMVAYILNILFVFKSGRHSRVIEIGLFYLVSCLSVLVGTSMMGFLIRYFGIQTTFAFAANLVSSVMINYCIRKFYIFKE